MQPAFAVRPGSYQPAVADSADVRKAADFALGEQEKREKSSLRLQAILQASMQVVAGTNYQLTLRVEKDAGQQQATVAVFRGLDGHYELKSWDWDK